MRTAVVTTAIAWALIGCASGKRDVAKPPPPVVTPLTPIIGKVLVVNSDLKYVVVDFSLSRLPTPGDAYDVFRMGMKVGEVRINEKPTFANFSADIIAGVVKIGDEVRKD